MITTNQYCGCRFAFDLPVNHPIFQADAEDMNDLLDEIDSYLETPGLFVDGDDGTGAKLVVVFKFDGRPALFRRAYKDAVQALNRFYEE